MNCDLSLIQSVDEIPCLPIEAFKYHEVKTGSFDPETIFTSSGTTGKAVSKHFVKNVAWYENAFMDGFVRSYGPPEDWVILALLPAYLERKGSSLVYMAQRLNDASTNQLSGFYLSNFLQLEKNIAAAEKSNRKVLLLGVTFALLDFSEFTNRSFPNVVVMETGGMKGRRKEMVRAEIHET